MLQASLRGSAPFMLIAGLGEEAGEVVLPKGLQGTQMS